MQWGLSTADRENRAQGDTGELGVQRSRSCRQLRLAGRWVDFAARQGARMEARAETPYWEARLRDVSFVLRAMGNQEQR